MTGRGFARGRSAAWVSLFLAGTVCLLPGSALAVDVFNYGDFTWTTDRADTAYHNTITFGGRDDVLNLGIKAFTPPDFTTPGNKFYQTEGYNTPTGLPVGSAFVAGEVFIPVGADTSDANFYQSIG